jgi:two-component system response regulator YesN
MGCSIIDYTLSLRINRAKNMLAAGTHTLSQIAERVGFEDYNYFSRVFKKRTGYTPSGYKKMLLFN